MDLSLWEKVKRYRRIAAYAAEEEMTRQTKHNGRLGPAQRNAEDPTWNPGKPQAAE